MTEATEEANVLSPRQGDEQAAAALPPQLQLQLAPPPASKHPRPRVAARAGSPTDRPNYRGVFYDRKNGRWRSQLGYQNRKVSLVCWAAAG